MTGELWGVIGAAVGGMGSTALTLWWTSREKRRDEKRQEAQDMWRDIGNIESQINWVIRCLILLRTTVENGGGWKVPDRDWDYPEERRQRPASARLPRE